jgi:hypothetical protein
MRDLPAKFIQLSALAAGGRTPIYLGDIPGINQASKLRSANSRYGYWLLDVTKTTDDRSVVIEANGSNGATSSIGAGDRDRIDHMIASLQARGGAMHGDVAVLGHQDHFHHIPEFYSRGLRFAEHLQAEGLNVAALQPGEQLHSDAYNVVVGDLPALAAKLQVHGTRLWYQNRTVSFVANLNIIPAVKRAGYDPAQLDLSVFHDGVLTPIAHDKSLQQALCTGTPFASLWNREALTVEEAVTQALQVHESGRAAVVKPHGTSGGVGVRIIPVRSDAEAVIADLVKETQSRYGPGTEYTLLPLRVFEFAEAVHLPCDDGGHLWDLRVEVIASPGQLTARPVMVRICPAPFTPDLRSEAVISNLTGRPPSTDFILGPSELDKRVAPGLVDELVEAALMWGENACAWSPTGVRRSSPA